MIATRVRLPRGQAPSFPRRCIRCGGEEPRSGCTVWGFSTPWWVLVTIIGLFFTKIARVRFPACSPCAWKMRFRVLVSRILFLGLAVIAIGITVRWTEGFLRLVRRLVGVLALVAVAIPFVAVEILWAPAVDLDVDADYVWYEFRDAGYAEEFSRLNQGRMETG